jgi:hypothetical protein
VTYLTEPLVETGVKLMYEQYPEIVDIRDRLDDNNFAVLKRTKSFLQALCNTTLIVVEDNYLGAAVPTRKWSYFEEQWRESHPEWIEIWKEKVDDFWTTINDWIVDTGCTSHATGTVGHFASIKYGDFGNCGGIGGSQQWSRQV